MQPSERNALDKTGVAYRAAIVLALRIDPTQAVDLFKTYDHHFSDEVYDHAFRERDRTWFTQLAHSKNPTLLSVLLDLATRLGLSPQQKVIADQLGVLFARGDQADRLISHLLRCQQLHLLTRDFLAKLLQDFFLQHSVEKDQVVWRSFFSTLPEALLPQLFQVHYILNQGVEAVRTSDSLHCKQLALRVCETSPHLSDVMAGLALAEELGDSESLLRLQIRAGDVLFESKQFRQALDFYQSAEQFDQVSFCHEHLGQWVEALQTGRDFPRVAFSVRLDQALSRWKTFTRGTQQTVRPASSYAWPARKMERHPGQNRHLAGGSAGPFLILL
ncbi:MAG: hypothetical protein KDA84_13040 [Planctomycetaceae bacterium]|nr:hypothetical protein [Planctomycetaceae bacterium]